MAMCERASLAGFLLSVLVLLQLSQHVSTLCTPPKQVHYLCAA